MLTITINAGSSIPNPVLNPVRVSQLPTAQKFDPTCKNVNFSWRNHKQGYFFLLMDTIHYYRPVLKKQGEGFCILSFAEAQPCSFLYIMLLCYNEKGEL